MIEVHLPNGQVVKTGVGTVEEIVAALGQNPYEILVTCGGELLLADDAVEDGAVVTLTSIVHGG